MTRMTGPDCVVMCNLIKHTHTHTHTHTHPPWEDQCEWRRMTRMAGPDCAVMCNLINTHTHIHTQTERERHTRRRFGVQQGCNLGPLYYSAGLVKLMNEFRANPTVLEAIVIVFMDDITVILPPILSLNMAAVVGKVTEWVQERVGVEGISLNRWKLQALLSDGVGPEHLTEEQRRAVDDTVMRVVGVPVGT